MANRSSCINNILPTEILQNIFLLSAASFNDALRISTICRLWRKLIFNPLMIKRYWTFDNQHRKENLIHWRNFNETDNDQKNPFVNFYTADCFLGQCADLTSKKANSEQIEIDESQYIIDRGSNYTLALWFSVPEAGDTANALFMVTDDDYDYARSAGVGIDDDNYLSIVFASAIGHRIVKSDIQIKPKEWYHIVLVQERKSDGRTPLQKLWINGELKLTVEVPIAAYSESATVSFCTWNEWKRLVADVSIWSRCLLPLEIRAIHQQKTSIDKVNIVGYIFEHLKT